MITATSTINKKDGVEGRSEENSAGREIVDKGEIGGGAGYFNHALGSVNPAK